MNLNDLLKKTQNKVDMDKSSKIDKVSIARGDRPYDEYVELEKNKVKVEDSHKIKNKKSKKESTEKNVEASRKTKHNDQAKVPNSTENVIDILRTKGPTEILENIPVLNDKEGKINPIPPKKKIQKKYSSSSQQKTAEQKSSYSLNNKPFMQEDMLEEPGIVFLKLAGCEKQLVNYFFEVTKNNNSLRIGPISRETICRNIGFPINTFKRTLRKLKDKKIIATALHKSGKGGWAIYEFNNIFYQELISGERINFRIKTDTLETHISQSMLPLPEKSNIGLPADWDGLDFEDLLPKGFTRNHLIQIYKDQRKKSDEILDFDSMQYSFDAFKFDLENNLSILKERSHNKSPVTFFTQILAKGRPYNSFTPEKFKTPKQVEFQKYREKIGQTQAEFDKLREKFYETEFQSWYQALSEEECNQILKEQGTAGSHDGVSENIKKMLKSKSCQRFFNDFVWKDIQKGMSKKLN